MGKFIFPDYEQNLYVTFMTVTLFAMKTSLSVLKDLAYLGFK